MLKSCTSTSCLRVFLFVCVWLIARQLTAQTNQVVYTDSPQNGWEDDFSWATIDDANTSPVHSGTHSISVSSSGFEALYFHHAAQTGLTFTNLTFWINGGSTGGQLISVVVTSNGIAQIAIDLAPLPVNNWQQESISFTSFGAANMTAFDGFWMQVETGGPAPTFYVDDITVNGVTNQPPPPLVFVTGPPMAITVDAAANQHPISPRIYGVAFGSTSDLLQLNAPLNRQGGNTTTRYNWQLNADNHAADYYFASLAENSSTAGELGDTFISQSRAGGAQPSLTIPMIDFVAKLAANRARTWSYSIAKYGAQQKNDSVDGWPDMGNGILPNGTPITSNDPNDANVTNSVALEQGWVNHIIGTWGRATNGGLRYYHLDNEPGIWHSTHQDVHPVGVTMDELVNKMTNYATMIKAADPGALVLGPEEWSFYGAIYSGYDSQYSGSHPSTYPDRTAHANLDVYPYVLGQIARASANAGVRLLDVLTIHNYPQGDEFTTNSDIPTTLLRNRSTRQLWDTNYVDASWLAGNPLTSIVAIIPRLHQWVATNYPGTLTGITEYNWGAETSINGATAQADILGIFGRESLDLAERWTIPPSGSLVYNTFKMYRNYDGNKSTFGDTSVAAGGPNADLLSTFAALRFADGALTVMAINKQPYTNAPVTITLTNFAAAGTAQVWQLASNNVITRLSDITFTGNSFSNTLPAQTITLFVVAQNPMPALHVAPMNGNLFNFMLNGRNSSSYVILTSTNLMNWTRLQTNTLTTPAVELSMPTTNTSRFFRAQSLP